MNWLLIVVSLIFLIGLIWGAIRGFIRIGVSLLATILTIVLVTFMNPYISEAVIKFTPLDEMIGEKCAEWFVPSISTDALAGMDLSQTALAGYDAEALAGLDLEGMDLDIQDVTKLLGEIPKDTQIKMIEESKMPEFLKTSLLENNNSEIYKELGVETFPEYVSAYVARAIINILSFVITFLFVLILVRSLIAVADLLSSLPVLHGLNQAAGAVLGIGCALILVWIGFLVITLLYTTPAGETCFGWIQESAVLTFLYEKNVLLKFLLPLK